MTGDFTKKICIILTALLLLSTHTFAQDTPDLFLNGALKDVQVVLKNSNTLVPLRFCSEALQARVDWNEDTQEIIITKGTDTIVLKIGLLEYNHNGETKKLLVAPELINGITYVPFRPLVEGLDGVVLYNNVYKFINIYDTGSEAYKVYQTLNSKNITEKRFAMLELPRISPIPDGKSTTHNYIFPLETPDANYFLEYKGIWEEEPTVSLKYYCIIDGVAVNTWGRQVKQNDSFKIDTHPLFKLVGDAELKNKVEFGTWPNPVALNYLMFLQETKSLAVYYINDIWTEFFMLEPSEIGTKAINPFSNKDSVLFDVNNEALLEKYSLDTQSVQ